MPGALFAFALLVRVLAIGLTQFDGLYGQDAFAYYDYARDLWQRVHVLQAPAPFWWPLGYPALVALAFNLGGFTPLAAQAVSVLSGALVAPLVYWWVREMATTSRTEYTGQGALVAGLAAAVGGELLQLSMSVMADASALMWALFSVLALLRYTRDRRARWWVLSLLALALATLTRWIFGGLLAPWLVVFALTWWRAARPQRALTHVMAGALLPLPLAFVQAGALLPATLMGHSWVVAWNPLDAFGRVFDNPDGHFVYALPVAVFYAQPIAHPYYLFPLLAPLVLLGAWALRRAPLAPRVSLFGWLIVTYGFLAGIPYENFRFGLSLLPPLLVLAGVGFDEALRWRSRAGPLALWLVALASLAGMLVWSARGIQSFVATKNEQLAVVRWTEQQLPPPATLLVFELTEYFTTYAPHFDTLELFTQTPESLQQAICAAPTVGLVLDVADVEAQWAGLAPEQNLRWLQAHSRLDVLGQNGAFTLFRVRGDCP